MEENKNIPKSVEIMRRISSKEFSEYFYKNIYPKLGKYEKQRKSAVLIQKVVLMSFFFIYLVSGIYVSIYLVAKDILLSLVIILGFFIILVECVVLFFVPLVKVIDNIRRTNLFLLLLLVTTLRGHCETIEHMFPLNVLSIGLILFFYLFMEILKLLIPFFYSLMKKVQKDLKQETLVDLLNFAGSDFIVHIPAKPIKFFDRIFRHTSLNANKIDIKEFKALPVFQDISERSTLIIDDYVTGKYKSVPIIMMDVLLYYEKVATFCGLIIKVPVGKKFTSTLYIYKSGFFINNLYLHAGNENPINLEDPVFEKYFDVYADDQVEARYILTTGFMNRLVSIASKNRNCTVSCSFIDGYMYLALDGKDWFDIPSGKSFSEIGNWQRVLVDFIDVFRIIDELKVEQNIGM